MAAPLPPRRRFALARPVIVAGLAKCTFFPLSILPPSFMARPVIVAGLAVSYYLSPPSPSRVSLPPFPPWGFPSSCVPFAVFDLKYGYLSKTSLISTDTTRTLHSWPAISVLIPLNRVSRLAILTSHLLPPATHRINSLFDSQVRSLVTFAITTLASHAGILSFLLSAFTITPPFPQATGT